MAFDIFTYKADKGRFTRGAAFGGLVALAYYGSTTFNDFLSWDWARTHLGDFTIPVLEIDVTPAFLISAGLFVVAFLALRKGVNHPKAADLLIDTEEELKRVTWPSWPVKLRSVSTMSTSPIVTVSLISTF